MARIRSIKPEFWDDRKLARSTSRDARLLYVGLWNQADEHGRCNGDPTWIKGRVFPYESDLGADECARLLDELARGEWVQKYTVNGDPYLFLPRLAKHQRLESDRVPSRLPGPDEADPAPRAHESARRADESAPDADLFSGVSEGSERGSERGGNGQEDGTAVRFSTGPDEGDGNPASPAATSRAHESASGANESAPFYVAGSREHVSPSPASRARKSATPKPGSDDDPDWLKFWSIYPKKVSKENARKRWATAVKKTDPAVIIAGAERYRDLVVAEQRTKGFIKDPDGWLNGKKWEDDLTATSTGGSVGGWMDN